MGGDRGGGGTPLRPADSARSGVVFGAGTFGCGATPVFSAPRATALHRVFSASCCWSPVSHESVRRGSRETPDDGRTDHAR